MADSALNTLQSPDRAASVAAGDLPDRLRRRYLAERHGAEAMSFFVDATALTPSFRDEGRRLTTARNDPNVIRDMVAIARHRGWRTIDVRGQTDFRREAWLTARRAGLDVRGYRPTERDEQELARRLERQTARTADRRRVTERGSRATPAQTQLRVVETVVRARVDDPTSQARILAAARTRLADWLERGSPPQARSHRREPQR
jgi:hypothetical protein